MELFVGGIAADERVGGRDFVERSLELLLEVPAGDATEYFPVGFGQARVSGPAAPAAFFEQFVTNAHATSLP
jgi:hypothetical protein